MSNDDYKKDDEFGKYLRKPTSVVLSSTDNWWESLIMTPNECVRIDFGLFDQVLNDDNCWDLDAYYWKVNRFFETWRNWFQPFLVGYSMGLGYQMRPWFNAKHDCDAIFDLDKLQKFVQRCEELGRMEEKFTPNNHQESTAELREAFGSLKDEYFEYMIVLEMNLPDICRNNFVEEEQQKMFHDYWASLPADEGSILQIIARVTECHYDWASPSTRARFLTTIPDNLKRVMFDGLLDKYFKLNRGSYNSLKENVAEAPPLVYEDKNVWDQ